MSRSTRAKKNVNVETLLGPADVKRLAKAANPSISLSHTKKRKTAVKQIKKSTFREDKDEHGRFPDALFSKETDQEVTQAEAERNPQAYVKKYEYVEVSDELLVSPVREELFYFLRKFVGHIISETAGRDGENNINTVVVDRAQVLAAENDLRFNFTNFYGQPSVNHRSKMRKDHQPAGAIDMTSFRKMLNHAVAGAITDKSEKFKGTGKRPVTFQQAAVDEIKLVTEQRISSLFLAASGYAGHGHRVALKHWLLARKNAILIWDVSRG